MRARGSLISLALIASACSLDWSDDSSGGGTPDASAGTGGSSAGTSGAGGGSGSGSGGGGSSGGGESGGVGGLGTGGSAGAAGISGSAGADAGCATPCESTCCADGEVCVVPSNSTAKPHCISATCWDAQTQTALCGAGCGSEVCQSYGLDCCPSSKSCFNPVCLSCCV